MRPRVEIDFSMPIAWIIICLLFKAFKIIDITWKFILLPPLIWLVIVLLIILIVFHINRR